jgi:hypothetical protein
MSDVRSVRMMRTLPRDPSDDGSDEKSRERTGEGVGVYARLCRATRVPAAGFDKSARRPTVPMKNPGMPLLVGEGVIFGEAGRGEQYQIQIAVRPRYLGPGLGSKVLR